MKNCPKCNTKFPDDKNFCKTCGIPLVADLSNDSKVVATKSVFEDRLKADPLNIEILQEYTQFLFNNLLFSEVNTVSLKILAIKENDGLAKELLFKSYFKLNMLKEAAEIGNQLLSDNPKDILLLENLAEISKTMGNAEGAAEYFKKILSLQPSHPDALYNKAQYLLARNQFEKAIEIFNELYKEGQNDRITIIYVGISSALKADYQAAIKLLSPVLSDDKPDHDDINMNRGVLYFSHSLCQISAELNEIKKWAARINIKTLKQQHHPIDEQKFLEVVDYVIMHSLQNITSLTYASAQISELTQSYLGDGYFTLNSNSKIAEIWYAIGNKQVEMKFFAKAVNSFQKAIDLVPNESRYKNKTSEIKKVLADLAIKKKRKTYVMLGVCAIIILVIGISIMGYKIYSKNKAEKNEWDVAIQTNKVESVQGYLNSHPNGKFLKEAELFLENAENKAWELAIQTNTLESVQGYLNSYPKGKFLKEAELFLEKAEKTAWDLAIKRNTMELVQGYLNHYPKGKFLKEAELFIEKHEVRDVIDKPIDIKRLIANKLLIDFKKIKELCSIDDIIKSIRIKSISLNPNGQQYIIELWGCNGTDDCADNWIYEFKNNNLLLLGDLECTTIADNKVHKVKTNGYFDFELTEPQHMSIVTSLYKFNGTHYKRTSFTEKPSNN